MIRELVKPLPQRRASTQSSARFFHLVDAIAQAHEPTESQLAALERSYNSTGDFLSECPEFSGQLVQIHSHGSRRLGTIVRPLDGSREGFDIDLIARLAPSARRKYEGDRGAALLLDHLHSALSRYASAHGLRLHRWERCATLEYAGGMCADIAPVIDAPLLYGPYGETHGLIPDRERRLFNSTNPRGYAKHFDLAAMISPNFHLSEISTKAFDSAKRADVVPLPDAQEVFGRLLCRLVQLLKLHRNVAFGSIKEKDLAPTSVFLTTLAAIAYTAEAPLPHASPLELLFDIVERMPLHFVRRRLPGGSEEWELPNPSAPTDNLAASMNNSSRQAAFFEWHRRLLEDLKRILDVIENHQGMDLLLKAVQVAFGPKGFAAVQQMEIGRQESSRQAGRAILLASPAAMPISIAARPHTFFGG
ncbi:nucleotidyltransferase [Chromobacterium sp. S0633]|uniref:nucleotidyltransferase domain-containing protein n=1 Tax=Chromobacterium sp. S0633 TaxID=2957805 RepID=UPI00209D129A|nr:nucleotidyltransferase [Chromobacterium sp. S0633]MCP1290412.1 nucleotidyltransferase [Chromobacterium sp. S0633]